MKLITKETFKKIFAVYEDRYGRLFVRVSFRNNTIYLSFAHLYVSIGKFRGKMLKIGFVDYKIDCREDDEFGYRNKDKLRLKILPEYAESIKSLFDLAISEIQANKELAFQMFQNIREYAIIEEQQSIPVPKYVERVIDYSEIQLGSREYSEKEIQYLMKDAKKTQKKEPN